MPPRPLARLHGGMVAVDRRRAEARRRLKPVQLDDALRRAGGAAHRRPQVAVARAAPGRQEARRARPGQGPGPGRKAAAPRQRPAPDEQPDGRRRFASRRLPHPDRANMPIDRQQHRPGPVADEADGGDGRATCRRRQGEDRRAGALIAADGHADAATAQVRGVADDGEPPRRGRERLHRVVVSEHLPAGADVAGGVEARRQLTTRRQRHCFTGDGRWTERTGRGARVDLPSGDRDPRGAVLAHRHVRGAAGQGLRQRGRAVRRDVENRDPSKGRRRGRAGGRRRGGPDRRALRQPGPRRPRPHRPGHLPDRGGRRRRGAAHARRGHGQRHHG